MSQAPGAVQIVFTPNTQAVDAWIASLRANPIQVGITAAPGVAGIPGGTATFGGGVGVNPAAAAAAGFGQAQSFGSGLNYGGTANTGFGIFGTASNAGFGQSQVSGVSGIAQAAQGQQAAAALSSAANSLQSAALTAAAGRFGGGGAAGGAGIGGGGGWGTFGRFNPETGRTDPVAFDPYFQDFFNVNTGEGGGGGGGRNGGGNGGRGVFNLSRISRYATGGALIFEGLRWERAREEEQVQESLNNDRYGSKSGSGILANAKSELAFTKNIEGLPILGQVAGFFAYASGRTTETRLAVQSAEEGEKDTRESASRISRTYSASAEIAAASRAADVYGIQGASQRQRIGIQNQFANAQDQFNAAIQSLDFEAGIEPDQYEKRRKYLELKRFTQQGNQKLDQQLREGNAAFEDSFIQEGFGIYRRDAITQSIGYSLGGDNFRAQRARREGERDDALRQAGIFGDPSSEESAVRDVLGGQDPGEGSNLRQGWRDFQNRRSINANFDAQGKLADLERRQTTESQTRRNDALQLRLNRDDLGASLSSIEDERIGAINKIGPAGIRVGGFGIGPGASDENAVSINAANVGAQLQSSIAVQQNQNSTRGRIFGQLAENESLSLSLKTGIGGPRIGGILAQQNDIRRSAEQAALSIYLDPNIASVDSDVGAVAGGAAASAFSPKRVLADQRLQQGILQQQKVERQIIRNFQPEELDSINQQATSGPGTADSSEMAKKAADDIAELRQNLSSMGGDLKTILQFLMTLKPQ